MIIKVRTLVSKTIGLGAIKASQLHSVKIFVTLIHNAFSLITKPANACQEVLLDQSRQIALDGIRTRRFK